MRHFHVAQALKMTVPEREISIEHYLRQPKRFLKAIMDPRWIEEIRQSHFRLQLHLLKFMTYSIQPKVDLKAEMQAVVTVHSFNERSPSTCNL